MSGAPDNPSLSPSDPASLIGNQPTPPIDPAEPPVEPKPGEPPKEPAKDTPASEPLTAESIKVPEGMTVDEPLMKDFLGVMNNAELTPQARAQALVDLQAKAMQAVSERGNKLWSDMQDKWQEDARTKFGTALEPTLGNISKLLDEYGGTAEEVKELRDVFTLTGAGNHPAMIRFLENLGKPLREGSAKRGDPGGQGRTPESILYPTHPQG